MARKRKISKKDTEAIQEIDGWKVGDVAWGKLLTGEDVYGEIVEIHQENQVLESAPEGLGPAVTMILEPDMKYRCILISTLREKGSPKSQKKLARRKASASKEKGKKK